MATQHPRDTGAPLRSSLVGRPIWVNPGSVVLVGAR
jgi:hypothetical protein